MVTRLFPTALSPAPSPEYADESYLVRQNISMVEMAIFRSLGRTPAPESGIGINNNGAWVNRAMEKKRRNA